MGVTGLLRAAAARPHVLVAAMPGGAAVRLATEEQLRHRGWPAALSPADADVLLVAGVPAADIAAAVETTWAAVPAPRVRAIVSRQVQRKPAGRRFLILASLLEGPSSGDLSDLGIS